MGDFFFLNFPASSNPFHHISLGQTQVHTGRQSPKSYAGKTPTHHGTPKTRNSEGIKGRTCLSGGWVGSSVALRALANRNRQSSRPWLNCSIHRRGSAVCRERCTQTGSRRNPTMESHPPTRHSKKTVCDTRLTKCIFVPKMHFASFYLLQKALLESLLWSKWAHFGRFLPYYGSKNSRKLLGKPPKTNQQCVKITLKWVLGAFWTVWKPFLSLLYRFPKEYKIKISTDFGSPGALLSLIGWQRAPL